MSTTMIRPAAPLILALLSAAAVASAQDQGGYMNSDGVVRTFYVGETTRDAGVLTFGCFGGDLTVASPATKTIRLIIPLGLGVQWDTTSPWFLGGAQSGKVQSVSFPPTDIDPGVGVTNVFKTIEITTTAGGFLPGDIVTLNSMRYTSIATPSSDVLFLDKNGDQIFTQHLFGVDDRDAATNTLTVANAPFFTVSGGSQIFRTGDPDVVCGQLNIQEQSSFPAIKVGTDIRIQIPSTLNMGWDTSITTVTVAGSASGKVDNLNVTYEGAGNRVARLPVTAPFVADDTLTINGLEFTGFTTASGPVGLQLVVNGGTLATTTSAATFRVAGIPTMSMTQQNFGVNDPATTNNQISVTNVPVGDVTMITAADDIEIRIPAGVPVVWAADFTPSFSFAGSGTFGAVGGVSYSLDQKSLFIDVTTTFDPGRILRINNLTFSGFGSASAAASLELDVDGDAGSETTTGANVRVVQPTISFTSTNYNQGEEATNAPTITVTNSNPGRIRMSDTTGDIRIRIPAALNMTWDTSVTAPTLTPGAGAGAVFATVTYPEVDNKTVRINVITADFSGSQTLTISGLRFTNFVASGPAGLELDVAAAGTTVHTSVGQIQIGGVPSILSASAQSFTFNDSNLATTSAASNITITDATGVPMITTAGDIKIKIPSGFNMTWDTSVTTIGSTNPNVSTTLLAYQDSDKTAVLNVINSNFASGESVIVSGLRFANFAQTGSTNLQLEVDGDVAAEDDDGVAKSIGRPNISSASSQTFNQGEESTAAADIVVTDDASFPRIRDVDASGDIRIRIPAGLNMEWDTSVATVSAVMGGVGTGNVASGVTYDITRKIVRLDVTAPFAASKSVTISGLKFQAFGAVSSGNLELICSGTDTTTVCRSDDKSITIGSTATISSSAQSFTFNDPAALTTSVASNITITDATSVPMITMAGDIRIKIPSGFNMTWDTGVTTIGSTNPNVSTTLLAYEDSNKTAVLNVINSNFGSGESVIVSGLRFANFNTTGGTNLQLEVDGDVAAEDDDNFAKSIGRPNISSASNQTFNQGEESTAAASIRVTDDAVARIRLDPATGDIRIRIPAGLNMTWDTSITTVTAPVTGTGAVSPTLLAYEDSGRTAVLNVTTSFGAGAFVDISGLRFFPFSGASGPLSLELIVNGVPAGPNSVCRSDDKTIQIGGRVTVSSAANQSFLVGDAATNVSPITVTDAPGVPMIGATNHIRLVIPAGLNMAWDSSISTITSNNMKVSTSVPIGNYESAKVVRLTVSGPFAANESVTVSGLRFTSFGAAGTGSLEVEVDGDVATEDVDDKTIVIGAPTLASAAAQDFTKNDPAKAISQITITENAAGAGIKGANELRIKIPATLNMAWDTSDVTASFGGTALGRVSNPVSYENGGKTLLIQVGTDFAAGETLTISGLSFTGFGNGTGTNERLTLEIDQDSAADATDTQVIRIGSPTISSLANQSFNVSDPITPISQITLTEDANNPRMTAAGDIRIRIPASLAMEWDTGDTTATLVVGGAGTGAVGAVSFPGGAPNRILLIDVTSPFSAGQTLTISNLGFASFTAESSAAPLELVVNAADLTTCNVDDKTKQIGGQASFVSAGQSFAVNDPDTDASALVITDAPNSSKITIANGIQIKIPAGLDMTWDPGITTITSTNARVTQTGVTYSPDFKTAILVVNSNFPSQPVPESTTITGLQFRTFGSASSGQLTLELDGDAAAEATDTGVKGIGAPTLSSSGVQVFAVGPGPSAASAFTITDDGAFPRIRAATGLRVRIPASLNMVWQNLGTAGIVMSGGSGNVSTTVAYADAFKTLVLTVSSDFVAGQSVTVSGLAFQTFSAPSTPDFLRLEVTAPLFTTDLDNQSKAIQGSPTIASASQGFTINDPATTATDVVITDAGGVATITDAQNIRIVIPPGLNMVWDTSVAAVTSTNGNVSTAVSGYENGNKTVVLDVTSNFAPLETVTIGGLRFMTFGASSTGQLGLDVGGILATDAGVKGVGVPTLLSSTSEVFQVGPGPSGAASFTLTDDAVTPRFRADNGTGDIRIKIPASLNMVWNTALTAPSLVIGGPVGSGAVFGTVAYPDGKTLVINVTADFAAGKTLTVSGLQFMTFSAPSLPAALQLEVNNAGTNAGVDGRTKAIQGTPTIASAAQLFSKGDLATNAAAITITDSGGVGSITTAQDIRIKIPAGLNMVWDASIATIGSTNAKVLTTLLPYEDAGKTAVLNVVTADFTPGEAVTVTGLRFASFGASSAGQLTLEIDGDLAAEATDAGVKGVGAPTISSAANQAFNVGDAATPIAMITVTEDAARPRLRNATNLRVRIPSGFNMSWDTSDTAGTVSVVGGTGTASSTVAYEGGGAVLVVDILSDFTGGEVVQISDLSFTGFQGESPLDRLELDVSAAGTTCNEDARTILIGGLPSISSASNQVFTVNDPAMAIATLTLTDAPGVATFRAAREIRVRIPAGFPMEWNQADATAVVVPGAGTGTAAPGVTFLDAKTLQIDITFDFSPGQTLTVSGLSFANFAVPGGTGAQLELDVDLDAAAEALDDKTLAVGVPTLSSASSQIFVVGDPPTAASTLVVTDGAAARIMAAGDVRIRIPASLAMTWDTSVASVTIGGSAAGKASPNVTYEDAGKTLVVDVMTDLAPLETLSVAGAAFAGFATASTPANLELEVNNLNTVADLDDKTKAVRGMPVLASASNQAFTVGDPDTAAALITVQDAGGVAVITTGGDIRISIPAGFPMTWNTALTTPAFGGGASGKVNPAVTYADADRTLIVDVANDFSPAEILTISGVGFTGFLAAAAPSNLRLDLDANGSAEATDTAAIAIGAPTLASAANQVFGAGDPSTPVSPITITEDAVTPRIKALTDLRIRIPAGMTWNSLVGTATLGGTAAGRVSNAVTFELADSVVVLDVTSDFLPGETLVVSGLEVDTFVLSGVERLRLETNDLGTDADLDAQTFRVGTRPAILSATTVDFNGNGSIDRVVVVFSEDVDGASPGVANALGFTLAGYTLAFGLETAPGIVTYFIVETGIPDTGATPALSYDPLVGALRDADEQLEPNAYGPTPVIDGAPPRIVGFAFLDDDSNGRLDRLVFTFSEAMDETQEDLSDWSVLDGDGTTNLLAGLTDASLVISGNTLTITLADTTGTTALPRYRYVEDAGGGALRDLAGLLLPNTTNNALPVANAGLDRTYIPTVVTLDGTGSSDVDGQTLAFSWTQIAGPPVTLTGSTTATPSFSAFIAAADYDFQLTVSDGLGVATDVVRIGILNVPPSAAAGVDQTVLDPTTVTLDGSASMDTNGDAITFSWLQVHGTPVTLTGGTTASPTFPTGGLNEYLIFRLTVTDSALNKRTDDVIVRINTAANAVPTADAGGAVTAIAGSTLVAAKQATEVGTPIVLDGRRSTDGDGDALTYAWSPGSLLDDPASPTPTFTPTAAGVYIFTLVVTDDDGVESVPATVRVTVLPAGSTNHPPIPSAEVLPAGTIEIGTAVTLNGSGSLDPEGSAVRYAWSQVAGPVMILPNPSASMPSFIPIVPGTYVFQLVVSDGSLAAAPILVTVPVVPPAGSPPDAVAAIDPANDPDNDGRVSSATAPILLVGTASTGTGLVFAWTQTQGPAVDLSAATTSTAGFTPAVSGTYVFLLVVRDAAGLVDTQPLTVVVETPGNLPPTANAGSDAAAAAGALVTLNGSASADPVDADTVTGFGTGLLAFWRQLSGPATVLSDVTAASPTFTPPIGGVYVFELVVGDGASLSAPDLVVVTATGGLVSAGGGGGGGGSSGGGCGLTGFEVLLLLALRRRRHMGCAAAR